MKKVLQFLYSGTGGVSSIVFSLIESNKINNKWKNFLILTGPNLSKGNNEFLRKKKIDNYYNKTKKYLTFLSWPKLFKIICKYNPDILLVHNFDIILPVIYKCIFKKKLIFVDHAPHFKKNIGFKLSLVYFFVKYFSDKIVVLHKDRFNFLLKKKFIKKKIFLIPNGIKIINKSKKKNFSKKKLILGMASRINLQKKHDLIIEVFKTKKIREREIYCYFAGDGENLKNLKLKVKNSSLSNKIFFMGNLKSDQLNNFYKKLDLYLQASTGEVMSVSILEAFNNQIPVLGSDVEGINNFLIPKKKIGILFKNNKRSLLNKIIEFDNLNNRLKSRYSVEQKKFLIKNFNSRKMFVKYHKLIEKI